jgi:hypothetical protein
MEDLRLKKPRMRGLQVKRLQEVMDALGFDTGPNDGIFGPLTEGALKRMQKYFDLEPTGICSEVFWLKLMTDYLHKDTGVVADDEFEIHDIRVSHFHPKLYAGQRKLSLIDSIVVHQTGCKMPDDPDRWYKLNAHIGINEYGDLILVNGFTDYIKHAQGLSYRSIGIEIEGNYRGLMDNPNTIWPKGAEPDCLYSGHFEKIIDEICGMLDYQKIKIKHVFAHRQSYKFREADPGEEIWREFARPLMERLGADFGGPDFYVGTGKPIPREWDPRATHRYWS